MQMPTPQIPALETYLSCPLRLVYPPISNQEAHWLSEHTDFRDYVSRSQVYAIGQREEVLFDDLHWDHDTQELSFSLKMGSLKSLVYTFRPLDFIPDSVEYEEAEVEAGPKMMKVWTAAKGQTGDDREVPVWFTPDKMLFAIWRGKLKFFPPFDVRPFTRFVLHYVGISKQGDSMNRLFDQGHKNRLNILTNERQMRPEARLTDEVTLFLLDVEPLMVGILDPEGCEDDDFEAFSHMLTGDPLPEKRRIVADVEKALIRLIDPAYNVQKYASFPASDDGLSEEGFRRYGYYLDEDIEFTTAGATLFGSHEGAKGPLMRALQVPDLLLVEGPAVWLVDLRAMKAQDAVEDTVGEE
jgi:hypothetical protein